MQHYAYEELNEVINVVIASLFQTYIVVFLLQWNN